MDSITEAGVEEFEAAYEAWDAARFAAAAELFRRACTATPANLRFMQASFFIIGLLVLLWSAPGLAAAPAGSGAHDEILEHANDPWTGDLDGITKRGLLNRIRGKHAASGKRARAHTLKRIACRCT